MAGRRRAAVLDKMPAPAQRRPMSSASDDNNINNHRSSSSSSSSSPSPSPDNNNNYNNNYSYSYTGGANILESIVGDDWVYRQLGSDLAASLFKGGPVAYSSPQQLPLQNSFFTLDLDLEYMLFYARVDQLKILPAADGSGKASTAAAVPGALPGRRLALGAAAAAGVGVGLSGGLGPTATTKTRIIVIAVIPGRMIHRIHAVKQERDGTPIVSKTWTLTNIVSLQDVSKTLSVVVTFQDKKYNWTFAHEALKSLFLNTLLYLSHNLLKKLPTLIGIADIFVNPEALPDDTVASSNASLLARPSTSTSTSNTKTAISAGAVAAAAVAVTSTTSAGSSVAGSEAASLTVALPDQAALDEIEYLEKLNVPIPGQVDITEVLQDFNWKAGSDANDLEAKLIAELQALEAANVHAIIQSEDHANDVLRQLDLTMNELDVIDDWLNHYTQVLESMGADVHQVELRNKSLQIAAANQNQLRMELEKLLSKLKIPSYIVETLRNEPLEYADGVMQCEEATDKLMSAIRVKLDHGFDSLQATKERILLFQSYGNEFAQRLCDFLFKMFQSQSAAYLNDEARSSKKGSLKIYGHDAIEEKMYRFRKLLIWLKEVDARRSTELQMIYTQEVSRVFSKEIHELFEQMRNHHMHRKFSIEDMDFLFVNQSQSAASAVTSVVMKSAVAASRVGDIIQGGKKLAKESKKFEPWKAGVVNSGVGAMNSKRGGLDGAEEVDGGGGLLTRREKATTISSSVMSLEVSPDEKMYPDEILGHALSMIVPTITREQNLLLDTFCLKHGDEQVPLSSMRQWLDDLSNNREPFKDVKLERRLLDLLDPMFGKVKEEFLALIDVGLKTDQTFAVGILVRTEEYIKETESSSSSFVLNILNGIFKKATLIFEKFVEDQQKVIEDTKVIIKKRSGLLPIFKTFPNFVDRLEKFAAVASESTSPTRQIVTKSYDKIIKSMFETLDAVVKDVNIDGKQSADDKEQVNAHIMMIENMHFMYSETRARKIPSLDVYVKQAKASYDLNLSTYCKVVIRRPFGKLLEFFEGIENLLKTQAPEEISFNLSYSKTALKEVAKKYPGKEVRKGLEALYRRVDKHFTEEEGSGQLLQVVWRGIQEEVVRQLRRYEELIAKCYKNFGVQLEFTVEEILMHFSEL